MALSYSDLKKPVNPQIIDPSTGRMREEWVIHFAQLVERMNAVVGELGGSFVAGPGSSTDGNLAGFDGTDGDTLQDSGIAASDVLVDGDIGSTVQAYDADLDTWANVVRASGFDTFAATPSSANLASLVTGETGSGALVLATSPTLIAPVIAETLTAGENLDDGDLCYLNSDGEMYLADADAEATADTLLAICTESLTDGNPGTFIIRGRYTTSGLTAGAVYYVSTTAGDWTATAPSGTGDIVRIVGYALSTTVLLFMPDNTYVEIA
jgi:hypothetical protein